MKRCFLAILNLLRNKDGKNKKEILRSRAYYPYRQLKTEKMMAISKSWRCAGVKQCACAPKWQSVRARVYDIKITIGEQDRLKIFEFAKASPGAEVYIKMLVERKGNYFHLYKPLCFKQKGNKSNTNLDLQDEDEYIRKLIDSNLPPEEIEKEILNMRCWVHSHFGPCFWSNEDNKNCEKLNNEDFLISVVIRAEKDKLFYNCRLDLFPPNAIIAAELEKINIFHLGRLTFTNLHIEVIDDCTPDFDQNKIKSEAEKLVAEKVNTIPHDRGGAYEYEYEKQSFYFD